MPGLVPGIHVLLMMNCKDVDGRDKPGHDVESLVYAYEEVPVEDYVACCAAIWRTSPDFRSMLMRSILSRLQPVTRTKRDLSG